jgi:tetrapyrrole methylase family protein/MazG family protein
MVDFEYKANYDFADLLSIMKILRGECPWDREQTHKSIRQNMLEEAYEACEAIDNGDAGHLKEELGDVLLQVVFHSRMEEEKGGFGIGDVCDGICKKLILRHPHIFSDVKADTTEEVLTNWENIKKAEKGQNTHADTLEAVARSLPSLWRAAKLQKKAEKSGFDAGLVSYSAEEAKDLDEDEVGRLLFSAVNRARGAGIDPEYALEKACDRFIRCFSELEANSGRSGHTLANISREEWDKLWRSK